MAEIEGRITVNFGVQKILRKIDFPEDERYRFSFRILRTFFSII